MNKGDLTRLIYFDTWIRNRDRYSVKAGTVRRNRDNVFFSERDAPPKRYHLVAMDHTHCFANGAVLDRGLERIELIQDEDVYGAFPEFQKYTDYLEGADCRKRLRDVTIDIVGPYLDELPAAWDVGADVRVALGNFLIRRAQFLAEREISHILK